MGWLAIVPAGGSGLRLGRPEPKAFVPLGGRPLLARALDALRALNFERIVIAVPADRVEEAAALLRPAELAVAGGVTRGQSVRRAFGRLEPRSGDVVCIHDAARPFVTSAEIAAVMSAAERSGAAIAATPIVDTVKRMGEGSRIAGTIDREGLWAAGTPQVFREEILRRALADGGEEATDEAMLCERLGIPVEIAPVSRLGFKVTTAEDLDLAVAIVAQGGA